MLVLFKYNPLIVYPFPSNVPLYAFPLPVPIGVQLVRSVPFGLPSLVITVGTTNSSVISALYDFSIAVIALSEYSDEGKYLVDNYFMPKCEIYGYCPEKKGCGRK